MKSSRRLKLTRMAPVVIFCAILCPSLLAQGHSQRPAMALAGSVEASPFVAIRTPEIKYEHKFLDRKNQLLFAAVTALDFTDFGITRSNLQSGGRELNPLTRPFTGSTGTLALNFAGETAGVIGLSYFFHKTGHHKLERMTSVVSLGTSATSVSYSLIHH